MKIAPHPGASAVARARSYIGKAAFSGMCQAFTVTMFGTGGVGYYDDDGDADAVDGWRKAVDHGRVVHASQIARYEDIPAGVALYWSGGSRGYGHAAVSIGGGRMVTTDAARGGVIGERPIRGWWASSHQFLGYVLIEGNGHTLNPDLGSGHSGPGISEGDDDMPILYTVNNKHTFALSHGQITHMTGQSGKHLVHVRNVLSTRDEIHKGNSDEFFATCTTLGIPAGHVDIQRGRVKNASGKWGAGFTWSRAEQAAGKSA